jgi:hypothetical protein
MFISSSIIALGLALQVSAWGYNNNEYGISYNDGKGKNAGYGSVDQPAYDNYKPSGNGGGLVLGAQPSDENCAPDVTITATATVTAFASSGTEDSGSGDDEDCLADVTITTTATVTATASASEATDASYSEDPSFSEDCAPDVTVSVTVTATVTSA